MTITAQEILVDNASYPTPKIEENSHRYRPLGLGYANLGALLMNRGFAYDSEEGRNYAGAITALMHGEAYRQSAVIARDHGGPFVDYDLNRELVPAGHRASTGTRPTPCPRPASRRRCSSSARDLYDEVLELGTAARLPQRAGHRARAHRDHRVHDGLRHHRHRARHRAHQVQEARRRGLPQDRQPDGPGGPAQAGLHPGPGRGDHRLRQRARDHRGRAGPQGRSTCRSSTARSSRSTASGPSTTWATSG